MIPDATVPQTNEPWDKYMTISASNNLQIRVASPSPTGTTLAPDYHWVIIWGGTFSNELWCTGEPAYVLIDHNGNWTNYNRLIPSVYVCHCL